MKLQLLAVIAVLIIACVVVGQTASTDQPTNAKAVRASFGKLPLCFVENRGVYPDEVRYYIQGADKTLFFTDHGVTIALKGKKRGWTVKFDFVGANADVQPVGLEKQQAVISYFTGPEKDWKTGLRTFSKVVYRDLWPGIDLVYNGTVNELKYEFQVAPGADPSQIRLQYRGASSVTATEAGALKVRTPEGEFEDAPPVAWQEIEGKCVPVELAYALDEEGAFGFDVGDYDHARALILDPAVVVYCGYIGGAGLEQTKGIAVDAAGNAYVTGYTSSTTFPVKVGPVLTPPGQEDAFVAKVNAQGTALTYCGYIGGIYSDFANGIAVDAAGNAYVTGVADSDETSFPVKVGPDLTHNFGTHDAFIAKVNAQGTALVYCGYIGGTGGDSAYSIAVDTAGSAYVAGHTGSSESSFPVRVGPDLVFNGISDGFVAKVNAQGTALDYCGYIGGSAQDSCDRIAVDGAGNAYVTGSTNCTEASFPVKVGPDLTYNGGMYDAFVAKVDAQGKALVYCGYIGGSGWDSGGGIVVDGAGNAYVTGWADSTEASFPVKVGPDLTHNGWRDTFVAKVNAQGTALVYCGYIGGGGDDQANGIALDTVGGVCIAGQTASTETSFPARVGPDLTHNGGPWDAFVAEVNPQGTALVYCGYIGGSGREDRIEAVALDAAGNAYVVGWTDSTEASFPVKVGPDLTYNGGRYDAFVAKVTIILLEASGAPLPGGSIKLTLTASNDVGSCYQVGSSLGTGPVPVGGRQLGLDSDNLLVVSVSGLWPSVFDGYSGVIDKTGRAAAKIHIPNLAALVGTRIYSAFVTLDATAPSGIRSISNTFMFTIGK